MLNYGEMQEAVIRRTQELIERQEQIVGEKKDLDKENDGINRELMALNRILDGLQFAVGNMLTEFEPPGLTDHIRQILNQTNVSLVPTQIRDKLNEAGVTGSSPKILLINIHTVLRRIEDELDKEIANDGKTAYIGKKGRQPPRLTIFGGLQSRNRTV